MLRYSLPALALAVVAQSAQADQTLVATAPVGSLSGLTVIVAGVDVTAFARLEGGQLVVVPPLALDPGASEVTLLDQSGAVLATLTAQQRARFETSGSVTVSQGSADGGASDAVVDVDLSRGGQAWALGAETRLTDDDQTAADAYSVALTAARDGANGVLSFAVGDVRSGFGSTILGESLSGRGVAMRFEGSRFSFDAAVLTFDTPRGYRDTDWEIEEDAYRVGVATRWERGEATFGAQVFAWADGETDESGSAFGLSYAIAPEASPYSYSIDIAASESEGERGWAVAQTLGARWSLDAVDLDLTLTHERASAGFVAPETGWNADLEVLDLNLALRFAALDVDLTLMRTRDNLEGSNDQLTTIADSLDANVTYALSGEGWRPEDISVFATYDRIRAGNGGAYLTATGANADILPDAVERSVGIAAVWSHDWGDTDIELSQTWFDERGAGREAEDWTERAVTLAHAYSADTWALSGSVTLARTDESDPAWDSSLWDAGYSLSFQTFADGWPELSVDYDRFRSKETIRAFFDESTSVSESLTLSGDFTPWLTGLGAPEDLQVTAFARVERSRDDAADWTEDHQVGLQISFSF